jgi:hypothetical protein
MTDVRRFAPALLLLAACASSGGPNEPSILIHSPGGTELGVSTEFGTLFLGRLARGGEIDLTTWFGDGPSLEGSVIEPLGAGLFTADTEIKLPSVPLTFHTPKHGDKVIVHAHDQHSPWSFSAEVRTDPRVEGILLRPGKLLTGAPDQIGAGVYVTDDSERLLLLGLVSGRIRLIDTAGAALDYVTVMGPTDLWRVVAHNRELQRKPTWVHREDLL